MGHTSALSVGFSSSSIMECFHCETILKFLNIIECFHNETILISDRRGDFTRFFRVFSHFPNVRHESMFFSRQNAKSNNRIMPFNDFFQRRHFPNYSVLIYFMLLLNCNGY